MQHITLKGHYKHCLATLFIILALLIALISTLVVTHSNSVHAATPKLSIQFTCAQAVDYKQGAVCVHTQVKAALTIKIKYCSGYYAVSNSLKGTQYADTRGNHNWTWTPQTKCRGTATAYVNEQFGGRFLNAVNNFTVA